MSSYENVLIQILNAVFYSAWQYLLTSHQNHVGDFNAYPHSFLCNANNIIKIQELTD